MVWKCLIFFNICLSVNCLLLNPQKPCIPTSIVKGPCHLCVCNTDGVFICHGTTCNKTYVNPRISTKDECQAQMTYRYEDLFCICSYVNKWMSYNCRETFEFLKPNKTLINHPMRSNISSNLTKINHKNLPVIEDGQSCIEGKMYKSSCNTCRCGKNNSLICTKMACLENTIFNQKRNMKHFLGTGTKGEEILSNKNEHEINKNIGRSKVSNTRKVSKNLPNLPKGKCIPGKTYSKGCKKCFCNNKKTPICTKACRGKTLLSKRLFDEDILALDTPTLLNLPELAHMGMECVPGKYYKVQCNLCLCSERRDLYCTMKYCVNVKSIAEKTLKKYQGQPCDIDYMKQCVTCKCKNKVSSCQVLKNCNNMLSGKTLLTDGNSIIKLALDVKKDKCQPNITYRAHCNDCYCQPEGGLRCTQKVCLTFSQIKDLQKREAYLEKHGL